MKNQNSDSCRISIYANDENGILSRLFQLFSKSRFAINFMQIFETEDESLKLIIVDATFPKEMMPLMLNRIEKILEVHSAVPHSSEHPKQFLGIYTVPLNFRNTPLFDTLIKKGLQISGTEENSLVLKLIGDENETEEVHRLLSEAVRTSFYKSMWPDVATFTPRSEKHGVAGFKTNA